MLMIYNELRLYVINYFYGFKNYSTSEEEDPIELKDIVIVDFCKYKKDLSKKR